MRRIIALLLAACLLPVFGTAAAEEEEPVFLTNLNGLLSSLTSTASGVEETEPQLMLDGHYDTMFKVNTKEKMPVEITADFGDIPVALSKISVSCLAPLNSGVTKMDADYLDGEGNWQPLRRNILFQWNYADTSEQRFLEFREIRTRAVKLRVLEANGKPGYFGISELKFLGKDEGRFQPVPEAERSFADAGDLKSEASLLSHYGLFPETQTEIKPSEPLTRETAAGYLYNTLSADHEYLPERLDLTKQKIFSDTEASDANELAALGLIERTGAFDGSKLMTMQEMGQWIVKAYLFETDRKDQKAADIPAQLAQYGLIDSAETFDGSKTATNGDMLRMLANLIKAAQKVVTYPMPDSEDVPPMPDYTVRVNGQEVAVYQSYAFPGQGIQEGAIIGRPASPVGIAYFDFFGPAEVEIELHNTDLGVDPTMAVRPLSEDIKPIVKGNTIRFTIYQPANLSVEPWGTQRPLHLFANPLEKNKPDLEDPNVIYFGPGVHYIDPLYLKGNETVYVDGGAVVYTNTQTKTTPGGTYYGYELQTMDALIYAHRDNPGPGSYIENITVRGRGIISARKPLEKLQRHKLMEIFGCSNVNVDGIILMESSGWNVFIAQCDGVNYNNIKMVGFFANNDGIDFCDSSNGMITNCFAHNADDSFILKSWGPVDNVTFRNCVAWNDVSSSLGGICELYQDVTDAGWYDCTVIHSMNPLWSPGTGPVLGLWNNAGADIDGVRFEDIVVEDAVAGKEVIKILVNAGEKTHAETKNVVFKNIQILDTREESILLSTPFADGIHDITFENVSYNGTVLTSVNDQFVMENTKDIVVTAGGGNSEPDPTPTPDPTPSPTPTSTPTSKPGGSSGGGSGGGSGSRPTSTPAPTPTQTPVQTPVPTRKPELKPFLDQATIPDYAAAYLPELREAGIISGDTEGFFHPDSNITRAELCKILTSAFSFGERETVPAFSDVTAEDWYFDAVQSAVKSGFFKGVSGDYFGAGEPVTRQDMAVVMARICTMRGITVPAGPAEPYQDEAQIADYARSAVADMGLLGLMNGYDSRFAPEENVTRAQTVKVIGKLLYELPWKGAEQ